MEEEIMKVSIQVCTELFQKWLVARGCKPLGIKKRLFDLNCFFTFLAHRTITDLREVTSHMVREYAEHVLAAPNRLTGAPLSISTRQNRVGVVRQLFTCLYQEEMSLTYC